jgi:EpsI family protein
LIAQAVVFYSLSTGEAVPLNRPLKEFPQTVSGWRTVQETEIEAEIRDQLKADDTLTRIYMHPDGRSANLFIAFFRSQRAGATPHSPKVCLPGAGWTPMNSAIIQVPVGSSASMSVNRYVISKGDDMSVVVYWYQTPHRVIANEYIAKLYLILDGIRYRRSDTAMIRVIVPVVNRDEAAAEQTAIQFVQTVFQPARRYLPA